MSKQYTADEFHNGNTPYRPPLRGLIVSNPQGRILVGTEMQLSILPFQNAGKEINDIRPTSPIG